MTEERGTKYGVVHLRPEAIAPAQLDAYLISADIAHAESLINLGAVYVNDARAKSKDIKIKSGDYIRVHTQPRRYQKPSALADRILESTEQFLIIDKPAGIPVHAQVDNCRENLITWLEKELNQELFVTHRLDIETSGCLIVGKTEDARREINQLFRDRKFKKHYVAVTEKSVEPAHYIHFMQPSFKSPKVLSDHPKDDWVRCELIVRSCTKLSEKPQEMFELEIELLTGRSQQIRAQLSHLKAPIIGDIRYGSTIKSAEPNSIGLRCSELIFERSALSAN